MCIEQKYPVGLVEMPRYTECPTCRRASIGGTSKTPDDAIWCQPRGMAEDRATDSRYHDVAGRDEKKNLFRQ